MKRLIVLISLLFVCPLVAAESAADAAALLAKSELYRNQLPSFALDVELTSYDGPKSESSKFRVYGKGADRSVVEFVAPAADKGRYLLMLRDAMWIFLPSTARPIRISPLQRLMGQASNGDVARNSFTVDYRAVSASQDAEAWVLELEARDPDIAYSRIKLWVDHKSFEPRQAEFYVASGKLLKRAHYKQFGQLGGRRAVTEVEIEDALRPGKRTVMRYSNLVARDNPDKMFTRDGMSKW